MKIGDDHWLEGVKREPLPSGGPMNVRRFLVEHFTAGASGASSIESMRSNGLSAHFVIERDGTIIQCVPCNRIAYHAGKSKWRDPKTGVLYSGLNSCAIGIEIANGGSSYPEKFSKLAPVSAVHKHGGPKRLWERFPEEQVIAVEALSVALKQRYNLDDVIGHEDCSRGRKTDPGPAFPMSRIRAACGFTSRLPQI